MIIKNASSLGATKARKQAIAVLEAGYRAIKMETVLRTQIKRTGDVLLIQGEAIDLSVFKRIGVVGIGKCALEAGQYLERVLGNKLCGGIVLDVKTGKTKKLQSIAGTHPLPSEKNKRASERIVRFAASLDPQTDLLICIISGGGSSLFFSPQGISVSHMVRLTHDLHQSGASIHDLNCVRKHLSSVQGGKLARMLSPLPVVALYFSDVISRTPGGNLCAIASGPLYPDNKTNKDARAVLVKYGLWKKYKTRIAAWSETEKEKNVFSSVRAYLLLTNQHMIDAMAVRARELGIRSTVLTTTLMGDADSAFVRIKAMARKAPGFGMYLAAGETTVHVTGKGTGGRNQQSSLAALSGIKENELFLSAASDGNDNTDAAGAIADAVARAHATKLNLDANAYRRENDSLRFFKQTKDFIKTGATGSNVSDVMIYMKTQNRPL